MDIIEVSELAKRYFENIDLLTKNHFTHCNPCFKNMKLTFATTNLEQSTAVDYINKCGFTHGEIICKTITLSEEDKVKYRKQDLLMYEMALKSINKKLNTNYTVMNFPFIPNRHDVNSAIRMFRKRLLSDGFSKAKYRIEYKINMYIKKEKINFGAYTICLDEFGTPIDDTYSILDNDSWFLDKLSDIDIDYDERLQASTVIKLFNEFIYFALQMMNCNNVVVDVPKKHNHIHKKKHKKNTHYTVTIVPYGNRKRYVGETIHTGDKRALHKRRGHFKDYTKGKGLFGRLKGIYWFEELVAGSLNEGLSTKDYKVTFS